jgi:hypothetical protein
LIGYYAPSHKINEHRARSSSLFTFFATHAF